MFKRYLMAPLVLAILLLALPAQADAAWLFGDQVDKVSDNAIYNLLDPSVAVVATSVVDPTDVMSGNDTVAIAGWGRGSQDYIVPPDKFDGDLLVTQSYLPNTATLLEVRGASFGIRRS